jgi:hypothetical protein
MDLIFAGCTKITAIALTELCLACPRIYSLNLKDCTKITDDMFKHIGQEITFLDLIGCESITDAAISEVARRCKQLVTLKVSSRNVTDIGVLELAENSRLLKNLELNG